jgi:hypothetical protein
MSITEIQQCELIALDGGALHGFSLELPTPEATKNAYCFEVAGWALGRQSSAVQIELIANDGPPRRIPIQFPRPDVDQCFPNAPQGTKVGFWAPVSVIGMTPEFELLVRVVLENTDRVPVAKIRGRHQALSSNFEPTIQPLLVNSLARTGTTWVMRLLSEHPAITTLRIYPYENRPAKYWMQLLGAMAEPAYVAQSSNRLGLFEADWWGSQDPFQRGSLGQNPQLQQWFNSRFAEQVAALCQQSIENCYHEIAAVQDQAPPSFFVEKHIPDEVPGIFWELYPETRELLVVRDFRDMLCSIRAFNTKRGTLGFNRDQVASEEEYISRLGREAQQLLSSWKARADRTLLVRYEDLIRSPEETLQGVLRYVGVDSNGEVIDGILRRALVSTPEMQAHRTSGAAPDSIGRWRSDLDQESKAICEQVFGELLSEFGYE